MKKLKTYAVICCVITLVFCVALGTTGFFLLGSYEQQTPNDVLAWLFRFFFIATPVIAVTTLITVARLKVGE